DAGGVGGEHCGELVVGREGADQVVERGAGTSEGCGGGVEGDHARSSTSSRMLRVSRICSMSAELSRSRNGNEVRARVTKVSPARANTCRVITVRPGGAVCSRARECPRSPPTA